MKDDLKIESELIFTTKEVLKTGGHKTQVLLTYFTVVSRYVCASTVIKRI